MNCVLRNTPVFEALKYISGKSPVFDRYRDNSDEVRDLLDGFQFDEIEVCPPVFVVSTKNGSAKIRVGYYVVRGADDIGVYTESEFRERFCII